MSASGDDTPCPGCGCGCGCVGICTCMSDWHDKYVREVQRNHDIGLKIAGLRARLDGLVDFLEERDIAMLVHDYAAAPETAAGLLYAITAAKGGE
jgi:hypothetical protein